VRHIGRLLLSVWIAVTCLPRRLISGLRKRPQVFLAAVVDEIPDCLKPWTIYLAGERGHLWAATMICPCGCGESIQLNLLKQIRPSWTANQHPDGTVSLMPSVWRQKGCRSHFFVRHGRVDWC
jgi:hypothetical protein